MKTSNAADGAIVARSTKRAFRVSRSKRHPKKKTVDGIIYEAKKNIARVAKVVKVYVIRKFLRDTNISDEIKKEFTLKMKVNIIYKLSVHGLM
jgi:hypothetical protein